MPAVCFWASSPRTNSLSAAPASTYRFRLAQSVERRSCHRRIVLGLGDRDRGAHGADGDGLGHRRLDPRAGRVVRTGGIKPTYGRVSRRGVFPLSWTLDHCGPLSRSVEDSAITLGVIAGHDPADAASADVPVPDYLTGLNNGAAGLRIGIPRAFFQGAPAAMRDVLAGIDRTADQLRAAGATVEDIALPDYALFAAAGRVIMMAEAYAIHAADMRERLLDYGTITANRFVLGAAITAADYINALRARRELTDAVNAALSRYDVLLTASALSTAPRFDAPVDAMSSASPMQTIPFNVTGHPAMSVPVGIASDGLPIGVQIAGRPFDEATVFRVCRAIEVLSGWESVALPM